MPKPLRWTEAQEATLRRMRAGGAAWATIAAALGVSRNAAAERAKILKIKMERPELVPVEAPDRPPLPPGHPLSWGLLVADTILAGSAYTPPGAMGRKHRGVCGDS